MTTRENIVFNMLKRELIPGTVVLKALPKIDPATCRHEQGQLRITEKRMGFAKKIMCECGKEYRYSTRLSFVR